MSAEDLGGSCADDGDGRGVVGGEIADGIEEDEAGEVGELAHDFMGLCGEGGGPGKDGGGGFHDEAAR